VSNGAAATLACAEFAIGFEAQSDCDAEIDKFDLTLAEIPKSAAFRAAQAFRSYRRGGGVRTGGKGNTSSLLRQ
jgi:hypothetical protein